MNYQNKQTWFNVWFSTESEYSVPSTHWVIILVDTKYKQRALFLGDWLTFFSLWKKILYILLFFIFLELQLGAYRCTECKKMYQTKFGLARHIKVNHQQSGWRYRIIDKSFFFFFVSKVKRSVSESLRYKDSIRNSAKITTLKAVIIYWKIPVVHIWGYKSQMTLMHFIPVLLLSYPQMQKHFSQH